MLFRSSRLRSSSVGSVGNLPIRGAYMITGGLGGLGLCAASLLVDSGAARVVLGSRSGRVARGGQGLEAQLRSLGKCAVTWASDSAEHSDVRALVQVGLRLTGVLHAAGAADKGLLINLERDQVAQIIRCRVRAILCNPPSATCHILKKSPKVPIGLSVFIFC